MSNTEAACRRIRAASTESQVIAAVRDYVVALGPAELAALPMQLLPASLLQGEEVIHSALQLIEDAVTRVAGVAAGSEVTDDMRLVLTTAARRLAALSRSSA